MTSDLKMIGIGSVLMAPSIYKNSNYCVQYQQNAYVREQILDTMKHTMSKIDYHKSKMIVNKDRAILTIIDQIPSIPRMGIGVAGIFCANGIFRFIMPSK